MFEVYAAVQPGRPRLAILAAAALLALSLLAASLIARMKYRAIYQDLDPQVRELNEAGLRVRLPMGWQRAKQQQPGWVIAVQPPRVPDVRLIVFRGVPRPLGLPSVECRQVLANAAATFRTQLASEWQTTQLSQTAASSATFETPPTEPGAGCLLGQAGMTADGQILGVLLYVPRQPLERDQALFKDVCAELALSDYEVTGDGRALMAEAGISFDPPAHCRWVQIGSQPTHRLGRLRMEGGEGRNAWYLDVARTPLVGQRSIPDLLTDHASSALGQLDHLPTPTSSQIGERTLWRVDLDLYPDDPVGVCVWSVQTSEDSALLMVGRHEQDGAEAMEGLVKQIAEHAQVSVLADRLDVAKALQRGRECLAELAHEGLSKVWGQRTSRPELYSFSTSGIELRVEEFTYRVKDGDDGHRWWTIQDQYRSLLPGLPSSSLPSEQWTIREDGAAHGRRYQRQDVDDSRVSYTELRPAGQQEVICEMTAGDRTSQQWRVAVDDAYACEPMLAAAAGRVALDAGRQPAVFMATGPYVTHGFYWIVLPAGRAKLPEPGSQRMAWAAGVHFDHDPAPLTLYYNDDGVVVGSSYDGLFYQQLQSPRARVIRPLTQLRSPDHTRLADGGSAQPAHRSSRASLAGEGSVSP